MRQAGATLHRGARASQYRSLSCCGAQAPDAQAQQLWFTGLVAPRHVGPSQTRARTRVPCIGRQILNHCATREALAQVLISENKDSIKGYVQNSWNLNEESNHNDMFNSKSLSHHCLNSWQISTSFFYISILFVLTNILPLT